MIFVALLNKQLLSCRSNNKGFFPKKRVLRVEEIWKSAVFNSSADKGTKAFGGPSSPSLGGNPLPPTSSSPRWVSGFRFQDGPN